MNPTSLSKGVLRRTPLLPALASGVNPAARAARCAPPMPAVVAPPRPPARFAGVNPASLAAGYDLSCGDEHRAGAEARHRRGGAAPAGGRPLPGAADRLDGAGRRAGAARRLG